MKIKKIFQFIGFYLLLVLAVGMYFTSCDNGSSTPIENEPGINQGDNQDSNKEPDKDENQDTNSSKGSVLSFNMKSIAGLGITDDSFDSISGVTSRAGNSDEKLLKILEDGSVEKFLNFNSDYYLPEVNFITKSPIEGSKEIYIVFNNDIYWTETDKNGNWQEHMLGNFLCVFEDGSYCDILQTGKDLSYRWENNESVYAMEFDRDGNLFYVATESQNGSSADVIYKFDPTTKESTKLVASVLGTSYKEFQISDGGEWLFVKGSRYTDGNTSYFLRAIPVSDPNNPSNLWYQSSGSTDITSWIYNKTTRDVFYIVDGKLWKVPYKRGSYDGDSKECIGGRSDNNDYNSDYFESDDLLRYGYDSNTQRWYCRYTLTGRASAYGLDSSEYNKYYYFINSSTSGFEYKEIVDYFFARLLDMLNSDRGYYDEETGEYLYKNYRNEYEIRFDEFANIKGFEKLATETQDKYGNQLADEELFEAIIEKDLLQLLGMAIDSDRYTKRNVYDAYDNNFFADILYVKGSNEKISPTKFYWDLAGGFEYQADLLFLGKTSYDYIWLGEFIDAETALVDAEKVLAKLANACGRTTIDFSLKCFENDSSYSILYTDLKNEEAIKFLDSDPIRMRQLYNAINNNYYNREFLSKTCFIPGTDKSAIVDSNSSSDVVQWDYLKNLIFVDSALYAIDGYNNKIVQLTDNDGNAVCDFVMLDYEEPLKFSSVLVHENKFYFKNSIMNGIGEETGSHSILCFDPSLSEIEDMMWEMPNNRNYEIVSFTTAGNDLYCCFVRGTEIFIGKFDLTTKYYKKFSTTNAEIKQLVMF